MKPSTFLSVYTKLEKLVHRLPDALQQPILREITPIKTLFLLQRAPRLVLLGSRHSDKSELIGALFGAEIAKASEEKNSPPCEWQTVGGAGRGAARILDARGSGSLNAIKAALTSEPPDLFLFLRPALPVENDTEAELDRAKKLVGFASDRPEPRPRLFGILFADDPKTADASVDLNASLHSQSELSERMTGTLTLSTTAENERLAERLALELPGEAQLEMARLSGNRILQKQIAQVVVKSTSAISGAVGAQPIPLADFPIIASLQVMMVACVMHISCREMNLKLAGKFVTSLGASIGAGLALREGARAAVKLVPFWGSAISGGVAAAGTYALGRAAAAYFIDDLSLSDARRLLGRARKETPQLVG